MHDRGQIVLMTTVSGEQRRPAASLDVSPYLMREVRHLTRSNSESRDVIEMKILQLVGADDGFAALERLAPAVTARHKFRGYLRFENGAKYNVHGLIELAIFG